MTTGTLSPAGWRYFTTSGLYQRAALRYDPSTKSDGALAASLVADTGQPMTAFSVAAVGPAPLAISSGSLMHTPYNGANSAGYLQANLGSPVTRIGAMVQWPLSAVGIVALVIPSSSWSSAGSFSNAGFHLSVNGNGQWSLIRYSSGGNTTLATHATHGRFFSTTWGTGLHPLDVWLDAENDKAVITWPDGTSATISSTYFGSETGNYAIWELFESDGSTMVPGSFGYLWADTAPVTADTAGLTSYRTPGPNAPVAYTTSGGITADLSAALVHQITLSGNATSFAFSNPLQAGELIEVHFIQDATGSRTLSSVNSSIKWAGAAAPTLTTTANRRDIFRFNYIGGSYYEASRSMNVG